MSTEKNLKLCAIRHLQNMNQTKLARLCDIDQRLVSIYENGKAIPPLEIKRKISEVLGCEIDELFSKE